MTAQNKSLQDEIGRLSTENRHLKGEAGRLTAENSHLGEHIGLVESKGKLPEEVLLQREDNDVSQSTSQNKCLQEEIERLSTENRHLKEETGQLSTENRHLKEETRRLTTENRHLEEHTRELQSKGKLPAEVLLQRQESYISQSSQYKRENNQILTSINIITQHYLNIEAENSVLRAKLMELSQRLQSLDEIISFLIESNIDAEDTSLAFTDPVESDNFSNLKFDPLESAY